MEVKINYDVLQEMHERKKYLELQIHDLEKQNAELFKKNELLSSYVLEESYDDYGIDSENRLYINSYNFGLKNVIKLFEMGFTYNQLIQFVKERDEKYKLETSKGEKENEPRF